MGHGEYQHKGGSNLPRVWCQLNHLYATTCGAGCRTYSVHRKVKNILTNLLSFNLGCVTPDLAYQGFTLRFYFSYWDTCQTAHWHFKITHTDFNWRMTSFLWWWCCPKPWDSPVRVKAAAFLIKASFNEIRASFSSSALMCPKHLCSFGWINVCGTDILMCKKNPSYFIMRVWHEQRLLAEKCQHLVTSIWC